MSRRAPRAAIWHGYRAASGFCQGVQGPPAGFASGHGYRAASGFRQWAWVQGPPAGFAKMTGSDVPLRGLYGHRPHPHTPLKRVRGAAAFIPGRPNASSCTSFWRSGNLCSSIWRSGRILISSCTSFWRNGNPVLINLAKRQNFNFEIL